MIRFSLSVAILDMTQPKNSSTPTNGSCVVNISSYENEIDSDSVWIEVINGKDLYKTFGDFDLVLFARSIKMKTSVILRNSTGQLLNRLRYFNSSQYLLTDHDEQSAEQTLLFKN